MTASPGGIADRPDCAGSEVLQVDPLSDVLKTVRLSGAVFFDIDASEPWVAETPAGELIVGKIFPGADHLIPYHVVTRGACWGSLADEPAITPQLARVEAVGETVAREPAGSSGNDVATGTNTAESWCKLSAGDIIVFPQGDAHTLSSAPGMRGTPNLALYRRPGDGQLPFSLSMGDAHGAQSHLVCGYLGCDAQPFNPLLAALPRRIHVSERAGGAIGAFVQFAVAEAKERRPGGEVVLGRLSELMFVDVVRRYLETLPPDRTGWLAALREPFVGRALTALHRSPARAWTLDLLAHEVALSRSALAERFTQMVGQPPIQYLTNWRMQLAANALLAGTDSIAAIADRVGYESEAAFSRAFKKTVGMPPSEFRRRRAPLYGSSRTA
jgi:AraC-like DNA-binding protein